MKKIIVLIIIFLVIIVAAASARGFQDSIKNNRGNAPAVITRQRPVVAIALFAPFNGSTPEEALRVKQAFSALLVNTGQVELRNQAFVDQMLIKHNLNSRTSTGWADAGKKEAFGRSLDADWIVQGIIQRLDDKLLADVSFYDPAFAFIENAYVFFPYTTDPIEHVKPLVDSLVDAISRGAKPYIDLNPYRIGDIGPAGGIIFFRNNDTKEGWRYLEAAPFDLGPAAWGAYGRVALYGVYPNYGDEQGIGRGKLNTEAIVRNLNQAGESNCAAQLCAGLELNGFNDWFLPSIDELGWLYLVVQDNIGGYGDTFQHDFYWSSSEVNEQHGHLEGFNGRWAGAIFNFTDKTAMHGVRAIRAF